MAVVLLISWSNSGFWAVECWSPAGEWAWPPHAVECQ